MTEELAKEAQPGLDQPLEEAPPEGAEKKEEKEKHEPPEGHPRWTEVYYQKAEAIRERDRVTAELKKRDEDIAAIKEHNEKLSKALDEIQDGLLDSQKPDRNTDPDAYDKWLIEKATQQAKKTQKIETLKTTQPIQQQQIDPYEAAFASLHPDYYKVIAIVKDDIMKDAVLRTEIFSKPLEERYQYAYDYGVERIEKMVKDREKKKDQGQLEGGGTPPTKPNKITLTDKEKKVAKALGIPEDKYIKQKEFIEKRGY